MCRIMEGGLDIESQGKPNTRDETGIIGETKLEKVGNIKDIGGPNLLGPLQSNYDFLNRGRDLSNERKNSISAIDADNEEEEEEEGIQQTLSVD